MNDIDETMLKIFSITVGWVIIYLVGAFIAWDLNPVNWLMFTTSIGRLFFVVLIIGSIVGWSKYNNLE